MNRRRHLRTLLFFFVLLPAAFWWSHEPVRSQPGGEPATEPPSLVCEDDGFDDVLGGTPGGAWTTSLLGDATLGDAIVVDGGGGDGRLRVSGDGSELFHGDDNGVFVHRTVGGDFRIEAEISGIAEDSGGQYRKACLMVRAAAGSAGGTGARDARLMACYVPHYPTPDVPALQFDVRFADGAAATELASTELEVAAPVRFAFTRLGDKVTVSYSADGGTTWIEPRGGASSVGAEVEIDLGEDVEAGVMVSSYESGTAFAADFDHFRACRPDDDPPAGQGEAPTCDAGQALDVVLLLDMSESMGADFPASGSGGPATKFHAAQSALERIQSQLELRADGTRAALVTFHGIEDVAANLESSIQVRAPLTGDLQTVGQALQALTGDDIPRLSTTPTALAVRQTLDVLTGSIDPARRAVVVFVTDGVPNIDGEGRGPQEYTLADIQDIRLTGADGGFLPWGEVAWAGEFNGTTGTFDGEPLGDAMRELEDLAVALPALQIYGVAVQGSGFELGTFNEDLVQYAAYVSGGRAFSADEQADLDGAADEILAELDCGAPGSGNVGDRVWNDLDGDGEDDAGEPGIAGVRLEALDSTGAVVASTSTDLGGGYLLRGLAPGTYRIRLDASSLPSGIEVATYDLDGLATPFEATVSVAAFDVLRDVDFGLRAGGSGGPEPPDTTLCDIDAFEDTLEGWTVTAIGGPTVGGAEVVDGRLELSSNGSTLWNDDRMHFVHKRISGDFRVEVDVADLVVDPVSGTSFRKGGLMVRGGPSGGLEVRSPRIMSLWAPNLQGVGLPSIQFGYRDVEGGAGQNLSFVARDVDVPLRLAIERRGETYSAYYSTDGGESWTRRDEGYLGGVVELDLSDGAGDDSVEVGVAVSSYNADAMTLAFDDFAVCQPNPSPPPSPPAPLPCDASRPLDVVFLMDLSGSMLEGVAGPGGDDRLAAARGAVERWNALLSNRGDGSRAALLTYAGGDTVAENLDAVTIRSGLTSNLGGLAQVLAGVDSADTGPSATTPSGLALAEAGHLLSDGLLPGHRPIIFWLTDAFPNVDTAGLGPYSGELEDPGISIFDPDGELLSPGEVAWQGPFIQELGTFAGEPVAHTMAEIERLKAVLPELQIYGLGLLDDPAATLDILTYAAFFSGGQSLTVASSGEIMPRADTLFGDMTCGAPLDADTQPPVVLIDQPAVAAGACLAAGTPRTVGGVYLEANPSSGEDGEPPPLVVNVIASGGASQSGAVQRFTPAVVDGRWSLPNLDLGLVSGVATVEAVGSDAGGNVTRAVSSFQVDAQPPSLEILLDGSQAVGAPGTGPSAASTLFGRQVSFTGRVVDDAPAAPPDAVFTLDGQPYAAGSLIAAEGDHLLVARATDCAGQLVARHLSFSVDLTGPRLISTVPANGASLTAAVNVFRGTSDPDLAAALVNGRPASVSGADFELTGFPWQEGENVAEIVLEDEAGHRTTHTRTFTVHTVPLEVEIVEGGLPIEAGTVFTRPVTPQILPSDGEASVAATLNGAPFASGTEIATAGSYNLQATASMPGSSASTSTQFEVSLGDGPRVSISEPENAIIVPGDVLTVRGTVERAESVTVNGVPAQITGDPSASASWEIQALPIALNDSNDIEAVAVDSAGRQAVAQVTVYSRDGGPAILILEPADGAVTNRAVTDVVGYVLADVRDLLEPVVQLTGPGGSATAAVEPDGAFRAVDMPLITGENMITATITDRDGLVGEASVTIFADGVPPTINISANGEPLVDGAAFGSDVLLEIVIEDDSGQVAEPLLRLNGEVQDGVSLPDGQGGAEITISEDGGYLVSVVARDQAGNEARGERSFIIDRGGCVLAEIEPADGSSTTRQIVSLRGRSGEAVSVTLRRPTGEQYAAQLADGTFLAGDVPLLVGANALEITCVDAGGVSQTVTHTIERLGGDGPSIDIASPAPGALLAADAVDVDGSVADASRVAVNSRVASVSGGAFQALQQPLAEGPNILGARATSPDGREASDRVVIYRDTQAPKVTILFPENNARLGILGDGPDVEGPEGDAPPAHVDVTGRVDLDNEPNLDGVIVQTAAGSVTASVDATGRWVALAVPLADGGPDGTGEPIEQTITAVATDTLGHQGQASVDVSLDPAGPAIRLLTPVDLARYSETSPAQIAITGEAWAADGAQISLNGGVLDPAGLAWSEPGEDGRRYVEFSASLPLPEVDGAFGLIARVSDPQDRTAQARRLLSKDSAPPEVLEMIPADGSSGIDPNALMLVLFSEPILHSTLEAADGLTLERLSSGEVVVGSFTVAGNAVGLAPGAGLARGESYRLTAGAGITDLVGHPLAEPTSVIFEVAEGVTSDAPQVDPLPAVLCVQVLEVTGTAAPFAQVKVRDGSLTFTGFADADGLFTVSLPISSNGFHLLHVYTFDQASGTQSPETSFAVRIDCSAPTVADAAFDRTSGRITVRFSEEVDPSSIAASGLPSDAVKIRDAEDPEAPLQSATVSFGSGDTVYFDLGTEQTAFWRDRPVRLEVEAPAADLEGNVMETVFETVFFPGGGGGLAGGFLFGEAWDDTTGRPLAGASARLFDSGAALPGAVPSGQEGVALFDVSTEGRGRYTMAGTVPSGRYAVLVEKAGYTRVVRRLGLEPSKGAVPFDSRLTPLAELAGTIDPNAGGQVSFEGFTLDAAAAALPGVDPLQVTLTPLSGQGLPDFLPLGWTPLAAVDLRFEALGAAAGASLPESEALLTGGVLLDLELPSWYLPGDTLYGAQYDLASGNWLALEPVQVEDGPSGQKLARVSPSAPGAVVIVRPDLETRPELPAAAGDALLGVSPPAFESGSVPLFDADLVLSPPVVAPTGKSKARVVARSQDGVTAWPSGLAVQAFIEEKLILSAGGGQLLEAPFVADLVLYHPRLSSQERGSNTVSSAGAMEFVVSPSPRAAQVLLEVGYENIRLYPFPEEIERGQVLGPAGGTVGSADEVELIVPEGALTGETVAEVERLDADELAELPAVAGYQTLAAVRLGFQGKTLGRAATLRLPSPEGTPAAIAGDPRVIVAELVEFPSDRRGSFARLVSRSRRQGAGAGERIIAGPDSDGGLPLDGIVREGTYLVLHASAPIGFATGHVREDGNVLAGARALADGLGTADLSRAGGRYVIAVPAGADRPIRALHPITDETAPGQVTVAAGQSLTLDLTMQSTPPQILAINPLDGAVDQPTLVTPSIQWSEPLDAATVSSGTIRIELAQADGTPSGLFVTGDVELEGGGTTLLFRSVRPLPPGREWIVRFNGAVADLDGTFYDGAAPLEWRFSTSTVVAPGGQIDASKFHVEVPVDGQARVYAEPGAIPAAQVGQPKWAVSPYVLGPQPGLDPVRETIPADNQGGFDMLLGRAEYPVTIESEVWIVVLDPSGQVAAEFQVGPFTTPDGKGFVAPAGEAITFKSAEGLVVDVPEGAFNQATLVKVSLRPLSEIRVPAPEGLVAGALVDVDFEGEANETLRLSVPAPASATVGSQVFVGRETNMAWGRRMEMTTYGEVAMRDGVKVMSNSPQYQAEPDREALENALVSSGGGEGEASSKTLKMEDDPPQTCADIKTRGLGRCFAQDLLMELTLRQTAAWYYEQGAEWSLMVGPLGFFPLGQGIAQEALANLAADFWVHLPRPRDSRGNFWILPVISDQPLEIVRRDTATGWIVRQQSYDPIPPGSGPGLVVVDPLAGSDPARPMLVDAVPFDLLRFTAPQEDKDELLRLEIRAETDSNRRVTLEAAEDFPLPDHTKLQVFDLTPLEPKEEDEEPREPKKGPTVSICDDGESWRSSSFEGTDDMLLVLTAGDYDPDELATIEFLFDRSLDDLSEKEESEIAIFKDLGPVDGCSSSSVTGYPRDVPFRIEQFESSRRLVVVPTATLAAGHRFRLELKPRGLQAEGDDPDLTYWDSAPKVFEFATREVPGEIVGSLPDEDFPLGDVNSARDMLRFGNLLVVATDAGRIIAVDASGANGEGNFEIHAIKNSFDIARTFATDGHNRLFYSGLFGGAWAIKTLRIEDVREAGAECPNASDLPDWAKNKDCFEGTKGSVRVGLMPRPAVMTASGFVASGAMPSGTPQDLEVLTQDEKGRPLELESFYKAYVDENFDGLEPDEEGVYTFDLQLKSTLKRAEDGELEPSQDENSPLPSVPEFREKVCFNEQEQIGEPDYDRFQRVTIDNLTTGQSWSFDIENEWPDPEATGDGTYLFEGLQARKGDRLQVRYNLRALGYMALMGSGITVVDLNRFYHLPQPWQTPGGTQCGRRLGFFEGATMDVPSCAVFGSGPEGIRMTPAVAPLGPTGCDEDGANCRGTGRIDLYSPLLRVGALHTVARDFDPGGILFRELAACIDFIDPAISHYPSQGDFAWLRDTVVAKDVVWLDRGIRGQLSSAFSEPPENLEPVYRQSDLLFVSMGMAGIYVFDVTPRQLRESNLVGHLHIKGHSALLMQVDEERGVLYAGGNDYTKDKRPPVINVWDLGFINVSPQLEVYKPQPVMSVNAPWKAGHIAVDQTGTGLLTTWDNKEGPISVPLESPRFTFSGLYLPDEEEMEDLPEGERPPSIQKATQEFVPLGVPLEVEDPAAPEPTDPDEEKKKREEQEREATAAFKLRLSLPGVLGEVVTAKVQSLRALPDERFLGQEDVGPAVALPGGPGWPDQEITVTLRRLGVGADEGEPDSVVNGEGGQLSTVYNLYESEESILLLSDPRARREYMLEDVPDSDDIPGSKSADEKAQCRRCDWPLYFPDPKDGEENDPELETIEELLAGRYVRAFLHVDPESPAEVQEKTRKAIEFFEAQEDNYRLPWGYVETTAPAAAVPSPLQVSLAEPGRSPATWSPDEAGVSVALTGGDLMLQQSDHRVAGRGMPFAFDRSYRSHTLGYGPLGSAGWHASLFASLREIGSTKEVEYHDGRGHVWRFYPTTGEIPEGYEDDPAGSYAAPEGVYLRLQKIAGRGWRLIGRQHDIAEFDELGRLISISDRHRRGEEAGKQGNTLQLRYDPFGQLKEVEDDLGRLYYFEYYDDPRPESEQGDGKKYGLLKKITDFAERTVEYEFSDDRLLEEVKLPEVENPVDIYAQYSYEGADRPTLRYEYDPPQGVDEADANTTAVLHGEYAELRLHQYFLPDFVDGGFDAPRARFEYQASSGRLLKVGFPTPQNQNNSASSVEWELQYPAFTADARPAEAVTVRAPWSHDYEYTLEDGRITKLRQELEVVEPENGTTLFRTVGPDFTYTDDGRVATVLQPDGGLTTYCYPDSEDTSGSCPQGSSEVDRLQLANVLKTITAATNDTSKGTAEYDSIEIGAAYHEDNLVASMTDGLVRGIDVPVPQADGSGDVGFRAEGVSGRFAYDPVGRSKEFVGGVENPVRSMMEFYPDAKERRDQGLLKRSEFGTFGQPAFWTEFDYDDQYNIEERRTSQGTTETAEYDSWDRPVRQTAGEADGRYRSVGAAECGEGGGTRVERVFDAAGHLLRERRLQDFVATDGSIQCRWVENRYEYNAREQMVAIYSTHLSDPQRPGEVTNQSRKIQEMVYDEHGRLKEDRALNAIDPAQVAVYRYDDAGRMVGVKVGDAGERVTGYDVKNRVAFKNDGDEGEWRGRYDAWDRLVHETYATGAVVLHAYDKAHHLTERTAYDADPWLPSESPQKLSETRTSFTSFGEPERIIEVLIENDDERQVKVTEYEYDDLGRVEMILSGPAMANADELDRSRARREVETIYEAETGRVLEERYGGEEGQPPLYAHRYLYHPDNGSPWTDGKEYLESVPGEGPLVVTDRADYVRDAFGRVVEERRSDGTRTRMTYDRSSPQLIRVQKGSESETRYGYDGIGRQIRVMRPGNRGQTLYAYDLDGRLLRSLTTTGSESEPWETLYTWDRTGRLIQVDYDDGTQEIKTYNPDNTIATSTTRDGVLVTFTYDAANREMSATPEMTRAPPASLAALDAGDFADYDVLSRLLEARRGAPGEAETAPSLSVGVSGYDLASRAESERVGARDPLSWRYDEWSRPIEVGLPALARSGAFRGFARGFDTLDRPTSVSALGGQPAATTLGADFTWGGQDRLYEIATRGALGTTARFGYIEGRGAQPPDGNPSSATWRLGTLTWGGEASDSVTAPTVAPAHSWGQLAFGWRGVDGDTRDGAKIGRVALPGEVGGIELFSGMGWTWQYDAGVRLAYAEPGRGDLQGRAGDRAHAFRYDYGEGDQLDTLIDEAAGTLDDIETGSYGRVLSREGVAFDYDEVGRRTEDDRFVYLWNWRSELLAVTVKDEWPEGESPFAGHQVRFEYDAVNRLYARWHLGPLPDGSADDADRPFIEKRVYVWEHDSLVAEVGYGDAAETEARWRKTYVPGARGLDMATQVLVEDLAFGGGSKLYTYLRDELGSVLAVVAEDEGSDPANPPVPARYFYTPYGEAYVEYGPELRRARFAPDLAQVMTAGGAVSQLIPDPEAAAPGGMRLQVSAPIEASTLAVGLVVEEQGFGGWRLLPAGEVAVGLSAADAGEVQVMRRGGWQRGTTYRVRLTDDVLDVQGRAFRGSEAVVFTVPGAESVVYDRSFAADFASYRAAADTLGGRFPGGQTTLFHGLWTDPVTGMAYARARWYDARNATWLSEDPLADVDSPNRYAYVGWQPSMGRDPRGTRLGDWWDPRSYLEAEFFTEEARERSSRFLEGEINGAWNAAKGTVHAVTHPVETVKGIAAGVEYLWENWDDIDLMEAAGNAVTNYINAPPEKQGELVGAILFEVASGGAIAKGATKLKMLSKLDNFDLPKGRVSTGGSQSLRHVADVADDLPAARMRPNRIPDTGTAARASTGLTRAELRGIRKKFGARRIADNPTYLRLWNQMLEENATRGNAVGRYMRGELKAGETLSDVFGVAQQKFSKLAKKEGVRLPRTGGKTWEIHHWNFLKDDFADIILDPGHLFFTSKPMHTGKFGIHNFLTRGSGTTTSIPRRFQMGRELMDVRPPPGAGG